MIIISLCLSFPFQVLVISPLPALIPYILILLLILFSLFSKSKSYLLQWNLRNKIEVVITLYFILISLSTFLQFFWGLIDFYDVLTVYTIYALPILFYVYFARTGSDKELQTILRTMIILGIITGMYYIIDNYNMVVLGTVNEYSKMAHEYSKYRSGGSANLARVWAYNRSHGLLERHSVSSAWIAIASFACLTEIHSNSIKKRALIVLTTIIVLLLSMNFTSLIGYIFTIILFEMSFIQLIFGALFVRSIKFCLIIIVGILLSSAIFLVLLNSDLIEYLIKLTLSQINLVSGVTEYGGSSYLNELVQGLIMFPVNIIDYPIGFLLGDGYSSSFSISGKGGDYGIVESLYTLGLPFFLIVVFGLSKLIIKRYKVIIKYGLMNSYKANYVRFAICSTTFIMFHEVHMHIWNTKSILPILFLNLAIFNRYGKRIEFYHMLNNNGVR
jgi:hypothetical protein